MPIPTIGGSEQRVPTQANVMMFGLPPAPSQQLTITAGTGYRAVNGCFFTFANQSPPCLNPQVWNSAPRRAILLLSESLRKVLDLISTMWYAVIAGTCECDHKSTAIIPPTQANKQLFVRLYPCIPLPFSVLFFVGPNHPNICSRGVSPCRPMSTNVQNAAALNLSRR